MNDETALVIPQKNSVVLERQENIVRLLEASDDATNRAFLPACANSSVIPFEDGAIKNGISEKVDRLALYKLQRLVYGADENPSDKLKSFFLGLSGMKHHPSVLYLLQNKKVKRTSSNADYEFSMYIGVRPEKYQDASSLREAFAGSFDGIFLGSEHSQPVSNEEAQKIREEVAGKSQNIVCVTAQPSAKKNSDEETVVQGLDQFIDVMRYQEYTAVMLATPVDRPMIEKRKREMENLHSMLSMFQKFNITFGENQSEAVGRNISDTVTLSESNSLSETTGTSSSSTSGTSSTHGYSSSSSNGSGSSSSSTWSSSTTIGFSSSTGRTVTNGTSRGRTTGENETSTKGSSVSYAMEAQNKSIVDMMARLDDTLKKLSDSETFGLWECAAYFITSIESDGLFAANAYKGLVLGEESASERSHTIQWAVTNDPESRRRHETIVRSVMSGEHPVFYNERGMFKRVMPTNFVSGNDLPFFLPLPVKSVPGLPVDTVATFERSVSTRGGAIRKKASRNINFGRVYHMCNEELPVCLDLNDFTGHCFITGTTGSGKSNTTELLIQRCIEAKDPPVNFLVVEPAKGEYKKAFKNAEGIRIFTTHPLCESLLHINPFKFPDKIHVLEHIDRLLGIFSSCWELTAAMPAILKKGVECAYQRVGWDIANSYFIGIGNVNTTGPRYPTFATLVSELERVIADSSYSAEAKGNYTGALVTRVESLTAGVLRQIFCGEEEVDPNILFDSRTIVDLSRLGSEETKTLIMGVLIMRLSEHRQTRTKGTNLSLQHITVIEEAHNLLRNSADMGAGGSTLIKKSVESIANAIAEMRTYGEGFLIVDQSPTAVDISAIKNTNTKIVMRLPEKHDCEAIASAMGLDEFQTKELSRLSRGVAVVMQNDWISAVQTKVSKSDDCYKGKEEWSDAEYNRELRARLALDVGALGYDRAMCCMPGDENLSKEALKGLRRLQAIEDMIDVYVKKNYDMLVGVDRKEDLRARKIAEKDWPMPARARELHSLFKWYGDTYSLDSCWQKLRNLNGFGMLSIALLGCGECWKMLLGGGYVGNNVMRNREAFDSILKAYVPASVLEEKNASFQKMSRCIREALYKDAILLSGGTRKDRAAFFEAMVERRRRMPSVGAIKIV